MLHLNHVFCFTSVFILYQSFMYKGIVDERIGEGWTGGWRGGLTRYCFGSFMIIHGVYGIKQMYIKDSFK